MKLREIMTERFNNNLEPLGQTVFSNEATFCLNCSVKTQNCRYWALDWMMEGHGKKSMFKGGSLRPFFIDRALTAKKYLELL